MNTRLTDFTPVGTMTSTAVPSSATALTVDDNADAVLLQAQGDDVYFTLDGSDPDPTASPPEGFMLSASDPPVRIPARIGNEAITITVIRKSSASVLQQQDIRTP